MDFLQGGFNFDSKNVPDCVVYINKEFREVIKNDLKILDFFSRYVFDFWNVMKRASETEVTYDKVILMKVVHKYSKCGFYISVNADDYEFFKKCYKESTSKDFSSLKILTVNFFNMIGNAATDVA